MPGPTCPFRGVTVEEVALDYSDTPCWRVFKVLAEAISRVIVKTVKKKRMRAMVSGFDYVFFWFCVR